MTLSLVARGTVNSPTDATSYATSAFVPGSNKLLVACYSVERGASVDPTTPTPSGHGTWSTITDFLFKTTGVGRNRICLFACDTGVTPASSAVTFDHAGVTMLGAEASVFEVIGSDLVSGGGASTVAQCFVQALTTAADASGTSGAITLAAAGDSLNRAFACWAHTNSAQTTPATNWTEIDDLSHSAPANDCETQWRSDVFDTAAAASWTGSTVYGGIAFEIKNLTVGNCPICGGDGWETDADRLAGIPCYNCTGTGNIPLPIPPVTCPTCGGTGLVPG